jgi:hypothetical protein
MKHLIKFKAVGGDADYTFHGFVVFDDNLLTIYNDILDNIGADYPEYLHTDCDDHLGITLVDWFTKKTCVRRFLQIEPISEDEYLTLCRLFPEQNTLGRVLSYGEDSFWVTFFDSSYCYNKHGISSGSATYTAIPPTTSSPYIIPKEHDVVQLKCDYAGIPAGSRGTVVNIYSPTEEEVAVEFANCNVIDVLSRHLEIVWTPAG